MTVEFKIPKKELEAEMVRRGYHVVPRRCSGCGGSHPLVFCETLQVLQCGNEDCNKLERECNCKN